MRKDFISISKFFYSRSCSVSSPYLPLKAHLQNQKISSSLIQIQSHRSFSVPSKAVLQNHLVSPSPIQIQSSRSIFISSKTDLQNNQISPPPIQMLSDRLFFARRFTAEATPPPTQQSSVPAPTEKVSAIVDEMTNLTLLEVSDLTELLCKKLDVGEMPVMAVMMPGMGAAGIGRGSAAAGKVGAKSEEKKAEKTAFDLKLESFDAASKIKIIKEVRSFTDLGLKEAKDLVEKAPALLKKGVTKEEAEKIIDKMKGVGAKVIME